MDFDPITDTNAIDGCIADLAAKTGRPQGYPFSAITVFSVEPQIKPFVQRVWFHNPLRPEIEYRPASSVPSMKKLDFKKAGKAFPDKVKEWKSDLSKAPDEFVVTADRFDRVDEHNRKTTGCRKYLIEVECEDQEERWLAIQFRKAIKKYVTEDMGINIVPPIFGDKYPEMNPDICVPRVVITLGDCSERLYQALEVWGENEFAEYPIRLRIPSRQYICDHMGGAYCEIWCRNSKI